MALFDSFISKATELAQTGANKSKEIAELAKLNLNNASEEDNIKKAYQEIGKLYYEQHGTEPEPEYALACEKVTTAKINIEENKLRIAELKTETVTAAPAAEPVFEGEPVVEDAPQAPEEPQAPETPEE